MEYIIALAVFVGVWTGVYVCARAKWQRWVFWFGFVNLALLVYGQFILHPYRLVRIASDLHLL